MKSSLPFHGVSVPEVRRITRETARSFRFDDPDVWQDVILSIWRRAERREELYSAVEFLCEPPRKEWLSPERIDLMRELIVAGAWWDIVDAIASRAMGLVLAAHTSETSIVLRDWSRDENIWQRRTAILAQLRFKTDTDQVLLTEVIEPSLGRPEFFLRKAIGWALREYSKVEPEFVLEYVSRNSERLSSLSKREGLKVLEKRGLVDSKTA